MNNLWIKYLLFFTASCAGRLSAQDLQAWIGKPMPPLEALTLDSQTVSLDRFKNTWYIVDFWASWCEPCIVNNRELQDIYKKYADQGLKVVSVSLDKDWQAMLKCLKKEKYSWKNFWQLPDDFKNPYAIQLGITHVPTTFLVNKSGTIQAAGNSVLDFEKILRKEFKQYSSDF